MPKFLNAVNVASHYGAVVTDADAATITFNCAVADWHQVTLGGNRTLAVSGDVDGQQFSIILQQDATGSRTIASWWTGLLWPGGTVPTLTTTANARDVFTFKRLSTGVYLAFVAGQAF